jgi:hypothetical protein
VMSILTKELGKISKVKFGSGGRDEAAFGLTLSFSLSGGSSGISTFVSGGWKERSEYAQYTQEAYDKGQSDFCKEIIRIMGQAQVDDIYELQGKPVEVTLSGLSLHSWRILEEVL